MIEIHSHEPNFTSTCNLCGSRQFERYRKRSDGVNVLRCLRCGMGVAEQQAADLNALYTDDYYGSCTEGQGYSDYTYTAEHGVAWAASLIGLLAPRGRILDIGCADGHLLKKLSSSHECYGVEVNPEMADLSSAAGIKMIASDVYDKSLLQSYQGRFNVICAIALFEHLRDFKRAAQIALDLLSQDGVLLFEVPLISQEHPSDIWFRSSLEHIYYPNEASLRYLFESVFQLHLTGQEVLIRNYASTFVGIVSKNRSSAEELEKTYHRLAMGPIAELKTAEERRFRFLFECVHAAHTDLEILDLLRDSASLENPALLSRLTDLWKRDVHILSDARASSLAQIQQLDLAQEKLASLEKIVADQAQALGDQAQTLEHQAQTLEHQAQIVADQSQVVAHQAKILETYASSYWTRLRCAMVGEPLSPRGLAKIAYFLALLVMPKSLRPKVEDRIQPLRDRVRRARKALRQRKQTVQTVRLERWAHEEPLISIIIPCFNYGQYVEEAVDSVLAQTFTDFEIIVIDGGSTDNSTLATLRLLKRPKTTIYFRKGQHWVGDNRNFGIERAHGKYICCLDADDKLRPTYLEKALFLLETYNYELVSSSVQTFGSSEEVWIVEAQPSLKEIITHNQFSTIAVFSKTMWTAVGGYHDWGVGAEHVAEDWDLWVRMLAFGARAANLAEPLMLYRVQPSNSLSRRAGTPPLAAQAEKIRAHNAPYLGGKSFARSILRNAAVVEVTNPNGNLAASFAKEKRRPHLLFALPFMLTGGADAVLLEVAQQLVRGGFSLSVITTIPTKKEYGDNTARYEAITKEVYHLYRFLDSEEKWKTYLFYLIESRPIDILLIVGCAFAYELLPELKLRFPCLKVVDQLFNEFGHIENNRKYARHIDMNVVASEELKTILVERYGESQDRIRAIVHGVDVDGTFNREVVAQSTILSVVAPGKFLVTFAGRFSEEKCPELFVRIANLLKDEPDLHFVMLGNGPEYPQVKQLIEELGLEQRIYAPGFVPDQRQFLLSSEVLVVCSRIEGIPIVLMESLSLSVPVVASRVGGIPSIIRDNYNGFLCEVSDAEGFANAIKRIVHDPDLRQSLRTNARESAERCLNVERMRKDYLDIFTTLVSKNELLDHHESATPSPSNI